MSVLWNLANAGASIEGFLVQRVVAIEGLENTRKIAARLRIRNPDR